MIEERKRRLSIFPTHLREIRESKGLDRKFLADKIESSEIALYNYENNKNSPSLNVVLKIANYFNCDLNYLVHGMVDNIPKLQKDTLKILAILEKLDPNNLDLVNDIITVIHSKQESEKAYQELIGNR